MNYLINILFFFYRFHPLTQYKANVFDESLMISIDCKILWIIKGLKTFSSKCPCEPAIIIPL